MKDASNVAHALSWYAEGVDFADALHLAGSAELAGFATFDGKFAAAAEKLDAVPTVLLAD
ncbi:MAG: hypothetical protein ABSF52_03195 [Syntrophobacteraceae bacterium]|jgi:hypothetical protein